MELGEALHQARSELALGLREALLGLLKVDDVPDGVEILFRVSR